jgi:hypothetical protein
MGSGKKERAVEPLGLDTVCDRGFAGVLFSDSYGEECRLTQSSIIGGYKDSYQRPGTSAVWLGVKAVRPQILAKDAAKHGIAVPNPPVGWVDFPVPPEVLLSGSMHLNREQVAGLIQRLQSWLDTGTFERDPREDAGPYGGS